MNNPRFYESTYFKEVQFHDGAAMAHLFAGYTASVYYFRSGTRNTEHG